jgi:hypothetical protein
MKAAFLTCTVVLAIVFAPAALAAGNGPTKSVYDHTAAKVQHAVSAALVVKKHATKKPTHVTHTTVASSTLPFTGLDLGFLAGAGLVLVVMGASLRRITRKSQI